MAVLRDAQAAIGYQFKHPVLLKEALTHKSHFQGKRVSVSRDNERLEFLGDAILALVVSEALIERFPEAAEGELSQARAQLVSKSSLAQAAKRLNLGLFLRLGRGEELTHGRGKDSLLANAFEAVIAAIYKDGGLEPARDFILRVLEQEMRIFSMQTISGSVQDSKSRLQEKCQKLFHAVPSYHLVEEVGPDHDKLFHVTVNIQGQCFGEGQGKTKKEAEQHAAKQALQRLDPV